MGSEMCIRDSHDGSELSSLQIRVRLVPSAIRSQIIVICALVTRVFAMIIHKEQAQREEAEPAIVGAAGRVGTNRAA